MSSWWGTAVPPGENLHRPDEHLDLKDGPLFGPLTPEDTMWHCAAGFVTETQIFYITLPDKKVAMVQVIHSGVGLWAVQIQLTFGLYDISSGTPTRVWKSVSVSNFAAPAPASKGVTYDKRSAKSDQFSILLDPAHPDTYHLEASYGADVQVSLEITRLPGVPGWKLGSGPRGGMTYFGTLKPAEQGAHASNEPDRTAGYDGYAIHRFWPRCSVKGVITQSGSLIDVPQGSRGMFVHAVQGMRPNLVACRWNFADFHSLADDGVSLVQMEFTTIAAYGTKRVTVGCIVVDDKLVAVTYGPPEGVRHLQTAVDKETGYQLPKQIAFTWSGPVIGAASGSGGTAKAEITLDVPEVPEKADAYGYSSRNLIAKVSVLAEIPYLVRKVISMAGTSPFIYQWLNEVEAKISLPAIGGAAARELTSKGMLFNEATFISEP